MKRPKLKPILLGCIVILILLGLLPVVMYLSDDPTLLNSQYPHISVREDLSASIEIKPGRPRSWVSLIGMSGYSKWAIIFSEDWSFYQHQGVDVEQMKVAFSEMVDEKRFRGASTITQQMVKNVYLRRAPTVWRKFHEIVLAQKVEAVVPKQRILEIYLNVIEYGPGIYGLRAAAQHYFKKSPASLTPRESAFLAMLLPSPKRYYVSFRKKRLTKFAQSRVKAILRKMRMGKIISPSQYEMELQTKFAWEK